MRCFANRSLTPHTAEENEEYKQVSTFRADLSEQRKEAATLVKTISETSIAAKNLIYESTGDSVRTIMQGYASHGDGQIAQVRLTLRAVAMQFGGNPSSVRDSIDADFEFIRPAKNRKEVAKMLAEFNHVRIEQLEHYELNPIPAASNAIRSPINTIECIKFLRLRLPNKIVEFFELRNILDANPPLATWESIEDAILTWLQSFKATMDEISEIDWREDEPVVNSKTSQFSNPPNKINASNANLNQDSSLPKFDGSN